jgi:ketosteroid isomerase-like protein
MRRSVKAAPATIVVAIALGFPHHIVVAQQSPPEQQLIQLEKDWCTAQLKRDGALLGRLLAEDYTGVSSRGIFETKAQAIAGLSDKTSSVTTCVDDNFKVRIYGEVAIVTARAVRSGTFNGMPYKDRRSTYIDVFVRKAGRWECVASQTTLLPGQT